MLLSLVSVILHSSLHFSPSLFAAIVSWPLTSHSPCNLVRSVLQMILSISRPWTIEVTIKIFQITINFEKKQDPLILHFISKMKLGGSANLTCENNLWNWGIHNLNSVIILNIDTFLDNNSENKERKLDMKTKETRTKGVHRKVNQDYA